MEPMYDILIELRGQLMSAAATDPEHEEAVLHLRNSMLRRGGSVPIGDLVTMPLNRKVLLSDSNEGRVPPLVHINGGGYWMSDRLKAIFDEFSAPCTEFFPATFSLIQNYTDLENPDVVGTPYDEPYWLYHNFNMRDVIDRDQSETEWFTGDPRLNATDSYFSDDDPPEVSKPKRLVLSYYPDDHVYGITGLPYHRFVSPELYDRIIRSGLVRSPGTFRAYFLEKRHWAMPDTRLPREQRRPVRINGRVLHYGLMSDPID